ncbi:4Fe-4S dicluster domain-containing protein [Thermodesulfobacterium hydrogeniphilum]|uniref:4Fe-4S dicluster domain-containing protein n=1 Tax=Thermodesulfobacterium hydrogeniphilum TaxID=161156 RepID=UPI0005712684|nr:4Fe-4S dicluster domain-containing protein [Thermodesulfobacterium hydrogeniphilum]
MNRREFLNKILKVTGLTVYHPYVAKEESVPFRSTGNSVNRKVWEIYKKRKETVSQKLEDTYAILVDLNKCIGCRRCEWACNEWNKNPNKPIKEFEKSRFEKNSVFNEIRRTTAGQFTVVNRFFDEKTGKPVYVKIQCMHCLDPACVSACFVGAFTKTPEGAVIYNPDACVGCRYCLIACPFDIPAYEYFDPFTPQVTKCTMCFDRIVEGEVPACVAICSADALKFGKRKELLELAHKIIEDNPDKYVPYVYGEHDFGGTNWLYISPVPFEKLGFPMGYNETPAKFTRNFLFAVKVLEILAAPPLVYLAYKSLSDKSKTGGKNEDK